MRMRILHATPRLDLVSLNRIVQAEFLPLILNAYCPASIQPDQLTDPAKDLPRGDVQAAKDQAGSASRARITSRMDPPFGGLTQRRDIDSLPILRRQTTPLE
jgi:hypothetical protein